MDQQVETGSVESRIEGGVLLVIPRGDWRLEAIPALDRRMASITGGGARQAHFDLSQLGEIDSAGAWLLSRTRERLEKAGLKVTLDGAAPGQQALIEKVMAAGSPPPAHHGPHHYLVEIVAGIGAGLFHAIKQTRDLLDFFGAVVIGFFRQFLQPRRIRPISLIAQIEQTGLNAMPIIGLISFLIGVVLAYQGYDQLRAFGGQIFTVNLVGISVLREMGILLTAIIVAGRTGSSFTAQIGTMQVNEEVDALRTLGLDPLDVLVLPRVTALVIALPLLTFYSDMAALTGGGVACVLLLDMSAPQYLTQLSHAVSMQHFLVGMSKAPIFALLISMVGCFEGLRVTGSAESVGQLTTQSVVESLFLVIVFDALFSVFFSFLHI